MSRVSRLGLRPGAMLSLALAVSSCASLKVDSDDAPVSDARADVEQSCLQGASATGTLLESGPEPAADTALDSLVFYELQVRSANACDPESGDSEAASRCAAAVRPQAWSRAQDSTCSDSPRLTRIKLGTFDDLLIDTDEPEVAISLRYIDERVGATAVWLQPVFPNNDRRLLPNPCDTLGSPYAVRDYFHTRGTLAAECVAAGTDEYSASPCWGDSALEDLIEDAHDRGMRVFFDVAFNHFGHDYLFYDIAGAPTVREQLAVRTPDELWNFEASFDESLLRPTVVDSPASFEPELWAAVVARCGSVTDQELIRAAAMYAVAFDEERAEFDCGSTLEQSLPAFYLDADNWGVARAESHTTTAYGWRDVKFLFHRADNGAHQREFLRVREYAFRIVNYWASRGVDGFRLDHATDALSGMSADEWRYIIEKAAYYAELRGEPAPIWLAEEFHSQEEMAEVVDILTEGYLFGVTGRGLPLSAAGLQATLDSVYRFGDSARVLTHLENHDEPRLSDGTGWDVWTGAGVWTLGAATRSTPMLLVGQEWGEPGRLEFRRPHVLSGRFDGRAGSDEAQLVTEYYRDHIALRRLLEPLRTDGHRNLHPPSGVGVVEGALATLRWSADGEVVLSLNNLWQTDILGEWAIPGDLRAGLGIEPCERIQFRDARTGSIVVPCTDAAALERGFRVWLSANDRARWAEMERCP